MSDRHPPNQHLTAALEAARNRLSLETLETRNRDSLDFHEIPVSAIREVVIAAFEAGQASTRRPARAR